MTDIRAGMAFIAGMTGGAAMSAVMLAGRAVGVPVSLEWLLGVMVFGGPGRSVDGWALGFGLHLLMAGVIGLAYGRIFEHVDRGPGWRIGASVGAVHGALAAIVLGLAGQPMAPGLPRVPGALTETLGAQGLAVLLGAHLLYGGIVGAMYPPVRVRRLRLVVNHRARRNPTAARATGLASGS